MSETTTSPRLSERFQEALGYAAELHNTQTRKASDTVVTPKPPWRQRKENYINHLGEASDSTIRVSMADKLDNARAIRRDLRRHGPQVWQRFNTKHPQDHLWYYRSLLEVYRRRSDSWLVDELSRVVQTLEEEV